MNLVDAFCYSFRAWIEDAGTECFQRVLLVDVCALASQWMLHKGCFWWMLFNGCFSERARSGGAIVQPGLTCPETGHKHTTPIEQPVTCMQRRKRQDLPQDSYPHRVPFYETWPSGLVQLTAPTGVQAAITGSEGQVWTSSAECRLRTE